MGRAREKEKKKLLGRRKIRRFRNQDNITMRDYKDIAAVRQGLDNSV